MARRPALVSGELPERDPGSVVDFVRRGGDAAANFLRERIKPVAFTRGGAGTGNRGAGFTGSHARPACASIADGKRVAVSARGSDWRSAGIRGVARDSGDGAA